jgi:N-acetylmuramoyl-L-alanine amidase
MSEPRYIGICVGHSRHTRGRIEGGALSHDGKQCEHTYNLPLAILIRTEIERQGLRAIIVSDYEGAGYESAQRWLAAKLKAEGVQVAIELHFNASDDPAAHGQEMLYWHSSQRGKALSTAIEAKVAEIIPELRRRGIKPKTSADRGAEFLRGTHCPACIVESGFGSNPGDWATLQERRVDLARAIAAGCVASL